jgi:hypothetical protein
MSRWTDWYWKWWLIIAIGLGFLVPEFWSVWDGDPQTQPLTNWTVARGLGELGLRPAPRSPGFSDGFCQGQRFR